MTGSASTDAPMPHGLLGRAGLRVSRLFLGAMTFGEQGGVGAPEDECRQIIDAFDTAGGNVVDTAINYRGGQSEEILGRLLAGRRDRFVVSTKYSVTRDQSDLNGGGNHRKNLRLSLETSLRRLQTDYVDLYWVHMWDARTPIEETMAALDAAVQSGKVLHVGLSDTPALVVARACTLAEQRGWAVPAAVQVPYNVIHRDIERELVPMAETLGLSVTVWSPLAGGVLSGKYTRTADPDEGSRLNVADVSERDLQAARIVQEIADEIDATASQVALAWTMAKSTAVHPIVGARRLAQVVDNLGAAALRLAPEHLTRLDTAIDFELGFPSDFIAQNTPWVFGASSNG